MFEKKLCLYKITLLVICNDSFGPIVLTNLYVYAKIVHYTICNIYVFKFVGQFHN